jgi:large subunit ribosomal protein L7/L12
MSITREDVIRYLEGLSSEELGELADEIQRRLGLPLTAAPRPYAVTMGAPLPDPSEMGQPAFDVVLRAHGADKLAIIRIMRGALDQNVSLEEVKRLVESAPVVVRERLSASEARELVEELRRAGAEAEVR